MEISPYSFCPNSQFENLIVGLLNKHLFNSPMVSFPNTSSTINSIQDVYADMKNICDFPDIDKKYMVDGSCLKVNSSGLTTQSHIYAGHDLPMWINDPDSSDCKVMIVGRDSGRLSRDMYEMITKTILTRDQLTIYSPFGMHSRYHRRKTLEIPTIVTEMIKCAERCGKKMSVYITDFYKFRKTSASNIDKINTNVYNSIFMDEITAFKPDAILLLGKDVMKAVGIPTSAPYFRIFNKGKAVYLPIPHPSRSNGKEINKEKASLGKDGEKTIEFFIDEICNQLKTICCDNNM